MLLKSKSAQVMPILYKYLQLRFVVFSIMHFQIICEFQSLHASISDEFDCWIEQKKHILLSILFLRCRFLFWSVASFAPIRRVGCFIRFPATIYFNVSFDTSRIHQERQALLLLLPLANAMATPANTSHLISHSATQIYSYTFFYRCFVLCTDVSNGTSLCTHQNLPKLTHPDTNSN